MTVIEYRIEAVSMDDWFKELQYSHISFPGGETLYSLGQKGWELCGIISADAYYFFFKRPVNEG